MPKTAAQLVPLRTQLANTLAMFRFAEAGADLAGNLAYQDLPYDNSGGLFAGQVLPGVSGAALPTTCTPPTGLALAAADAPSGARTAGLNKYHAGSPFYWVAFTDASGREGQSYFISPTIPLSAHGSASITFNISFPAGATSCRIYKYINANGCYSWDIPNTVSSATDTTNQYGIFGIPAGVTRAGYNYPNPNGASTAPVAGSDTVTFIVNATGGGFAATTYAFNMTAYTTLGESAGIGQQNVQIEGGPLIHGAAAGRMNPISVADGTAGAGTLPAGTWRYQVTAYTDPPNVIYGSMNGCTIRSGAGQTESLPSPEVTFTRTAAGNNVLTWVPVPHAAGYCIYRSRDLPPPVANAPTIATTGGTIAASTTYDYIVTAVNPNGETIGSNVVTGTTDATTATNTITVTWGAVAHAHGYRIYRGTGATPTFVRVGDVALGSTTTFTDTGAAPGTANPPAANTATGAGLGVLLAQVGTGGTTSYIDSGGNVSVNSGFRPPKEYNGARSAQQVTATWTASADTNVQGYFLYRSSTNNASNGITMAARQVAGRTSVSSVDDLTGFANRLLPLANYGGTNEVRTVGRYLQVHPFETFLTRLGFSAALVQGKRYRFGVYDATANLNRWNSAYFMAGSSTETYYEASGMAVLAPANHNVYFFLQGEDAGSTITWRSNPITTTDFPSQVQAEHGTMAAATANMAISTKNLNNAGDWPTYTRDSAANRLPMKIHLRQSVAATSAVNVGRGTLVGDTRYARYALSPNRTFQTPIRAIVPSWTLDLPRSPLSQNELAKRWIEIAVSPDGGVTFYPLVSGERFVLPSPATQLQFRYTLPEASARASFDRRVMTGIPADGTNWGTNYGFHSDTGHQMFYYENASSNMHTSSNGNLLVGNWNNTYIYSNNSFIGLGRDVDMTMTGYFNQTGYFGIKFRHQGKAYQGYFFALNNNGDCFLDRQTNDSTAVTRLATVHGVASNVFNVPRTLRVIAVGSHYLCFVDGRLVIDTTDATYADNSYIHHGFAGARGIATSISATSLSEPNKTVPWELEYVTAYLET